MENSEDVVIDVHTSFHAKFANVSAGVNVAQRVNKQIRFGWISDLRMWCKACCMA